MKIFRDVTNHTYWTADSEDVLSIDDCLNYRALAKSATEIIAFDAPVYTSGWNRHLWSLHPEGLASYAATMKGQPHYEHHVSERLLGTCGEGRVEGDQLVQSLTYDTPLGLSIGGHTHFLRFSIGAARTEKSRVVCGICDNEWLESGCQHWLGDNNFQLLITDMVARETSTTHSPACTGTGSDAGLSDDELELASPFGRLPQWVLGLAGQRSQRKMAEYTETLSQRVAELEEAERGRREMRRKLSLHQVRRDRETRALATPMGMTVSEYEQMLADLLEANPKSYHAIIKSVPKAATSRSVSFDVGEPEPRREPPTEGTQDYYDWVRAESLALADREGISYAAARKRLQEAK